MEAKLLLHPISLEYTGTRGNTGATGATGADGKDGQMLYATCGTAAATAAKVATLAAGSLTLKAGVTVSVKFTYSNTASSPTLNVAGTGAKAIYTQGVRYAYWRANSTVVFTYDGSYWRVASEPVYANTATIGNPGGANVYLDSNTVNVRQGSANRFTFGNNGERNYIKGQGIYLGQNRQMNQVQVPPHIWRFWKTKLIRMRGRLLAKEI